MTRRFRLPFTRRRARTDAGAEVAFHLQGRVEELMASGLARADAEREARRRFGDPGTVEAEVERIDAAAHRRREFREALGARARDFRLAVRALARRPGYAVTVILTLGLGMGASTAIFTMLQRIVIAPLPYPAADRLVRLRNPIPAVGTSAEWDMAFAQYYEYLKAPAIEAIGLFHKDEVNVDLGGGAPVRAKLATVNVSLLDIIGARAVRGRLLRPSDDVPGAADVALISHGTWQSRFGGAEDIVGRTIRMNDQPVVIVGVLAYGIELPPERGEPFTVHSEIWVAQKLNPAGPFYNNHTHPMVARLRPGATVEQLQAQLDQLLLNLPTDFPQAYRAGGVGRAKFWTRAYPLQAYVVGDIARNLWIAFGAVLLVLVIACANVGNLFLVRLETRRRELALRATLGASRSDIAFEAFAEGFALALAGGALAIGIGLGGLRWLVHLAPAGIPRLDEVALDWHTYGFVGGVALVTAAVFAVVPVLQFRHAAASAALGDGGRSATVGVQRQRVRGALVVTQVALALMLLVGATLLLQSFRTLRRVDPGIAPAGVMTVEWFLPAQRYDSLPKVWRFDDAVLAGVRALPGVAAAGITDALPFEDDFGCTVQGFEDRAVYDRLNQAHVSTCAGQGVATPGFVEALGIPVVAGRWFTPDDNNSPERGAVVVTKAAAERFWPGEDPIGKGIGPNGYNTPPFYRVVGVIGDLHDTSLDGPPVIGVYYPVVAIPNGHRWYPDASRLVVRTTRDRPLDVVEDIRRVVAKVDPTIPIANATLMQDRVDRSMARLTFTMSLLMIAGGVAIALAAVGLYGVISYLVVRRTSEIGVRIALGAQASQVEGMVVGGAVRLGVTGLVIGLAGSVASARVLRGLLYGVQPWDPASYLAAALALVAVVVVAGWIPARRAARVSPMEALRAD
ncbi:MAG TPA: ABC transporter permease [Gemmatimonadaceae bacterium]|nr:ABC transporter permease [Gemmatimonadaceae bacterium]